MTTLPGPLVSTDWLAQHRDDPGVRIADGSYFLPHLKRDAGAEFLAKHIPGAVRFDIDDIKDPDDPLPHMLPSADIFAAKVGALGISNDHAVVAYDALGLMSAARVWWMFRAFGHDNVAVLDGGLPKWVKEGRPVATGAATPRPTRFTARFRPELVRDRVAVAADLASKREQVLDARSRGRFAGTEPELRAGLRGGHMPGALNLPFTDLLGPDGTMLPPDRIAALFQAAAVDPARPVVTSCGSGVTACVLALGLHLIGNKNAAVYDGSWTEWGGRSDTAVTT